MIIFPKVLNFFFKSFLLYFFCSFLYCSFLSFTLSFSICGSYCGFKTVFPLNLFFASNITNLFSLLLFYNYIFKVLDIKFLKALNSYIYIFLHTLSFALLLLELISFSSFEGSIGFFVIIFICGSFPQTQIGKLGGQVHGFSSFFKFHLYYSILQRMKGYYA